MVPRAQVPVGSEGNETEEGRPGQIMNGLEYHAKHLNFVIGFGNLFNIVEFEKLEVRGMT